MDDSLINQVIYDIFIFQERPSIINEICSDYKKEWLDNDIVTELIFPNLPMMFFLNKSKMKKSKSQKSINQHSFNNIFIKSSIIMVQENYIMV